VNLRRGLVIGAAALSVAVPGCSSSHSAAKGQAPLKSSSPTTSASASAATVWLCRPGSKPDPCTSDLTTTLVAANGTRRVVPGPKPKDTGLDCFYVYPTVSEESGANADLRVQSAETNVAVAQAAWFSTTCRVWAPMYHQRTVGDLLNLADGAPDSVANRTAFASVESAWRDYLAHDNNGRPVVLIGHSQGASMLIRLLRNDIDPVPAMRAKVALSLLLGGNVTVADGQLTGGSFRHVPLCTHKGQRGCVIAYSSFPSVPPSFALFGRAGAGVSLLSGETAVDRQVACVNPAAVAGGAAPLHTLFPSGAAPGLVASTPWIGAIGRFTGQCRRADGATWLQVTAVAHDVRPKLKESLGPIWGYHVADVNLALGDLVSDVAAVAH
jgi:hypothetical protein